MFKITNPQWKKKITLLHWPIPMNKCYFCSWFQTTYMTSTILQNSIKFKNYPCEPVWTGLAHYQIATTELSECVTVWNFHLKEKIEIFLGFFIWYFLLFFFLLLGMNMSLFHIFQNSNFALSFIIFNVLCFKACNFNFHKNTFFTQADVRVY